MGTKRHMADHVRATMLELTPRGRVVDLFSGMGSVAESLKDTVNVVTNDALSFTASLSRARIKGDDRFVRPDEMARRLAGAYLFRLDELEGQYSEQLNEESEALLGGLVRLTNYIQTSKHVGNCVDLRRRAQRALEAGDSSHYQLASLYFSAGYLSLHQAIEVDAIRYAIDLHDEIGHRDWLLGSWISGTSVIVNAPGHTAQFLKPNTPSGHSRIVRTWSRSVWDQFAAALCDVSQVGTEEWRSGNSVNVGDALHFIGGGHPGDIGAVYADPPYTKDQYSRFYHLYETLYRYDYPESTGAGRNRPDLFKTGFCLKTAVLASFHDLCRNVARMSVPLVISYPSVGLLAEAGVTVPDVATAYFANVSIRSFETNHSTMGASSGKSKKPATENLYVCTS